MLRTAGLYQGRYSQPSASRTQTIPPPPETPQEALTSHAAVGGALGLVRARDTGNSPTRARLATPLSTSYRELPVSPPVLQPQFSATNPFSNASALPRTAGGICGTKRFGRVNEPATVSIDSALGGQFAHGILTKDNLIPPLYVPPIEVAERATPTTGPTGAIAYAASESDAVVISSPTTSSSGASTLPRIVGSKPPLQHRGAVTVVFDLDETLCNNRRPGKALLRPHTLELLHHLNALRNDPAVNCYVELILWTASMECVARPVVERLDPTGTLFQHLIYRDRRWYKESGYTKDLKRLGRDMHHTVIIENSPASVYLNRKHSILVHDFVSGPDTELVTVKDVLDGWIRATGDCARTLQAPPPNDPSSPSSIVRYLSEHPAINSGNEVIRQKPQPDTAKPASSLSQRFGGSGLGLSVTRFAVTRPSMYPGRR